MKIFFHRKPYLTFIIAGAAVIVFDIVFFTHTVIAQPAVVLAETGDFDITLKIINLAWLIMSAIGFVAAFVWYVVKGKSSEQLKETNAQLKMHNEELRAKISDIKADLVEAKAEIRNLEMENENIRKANLRLQGIHDTQG